MALRYLITILGFSIISLTSVKADARDQKIVQEEFLKAFDVMYAHPDDADATLRYAALALEKGDHEAAVSPLERLLMMNPQLPEVRLQLGRAYYYLKSYDNARMHLEIVKKDKALMAQADELLKKLPQE